MKSADVRRTFIEFFEKNGHKHVNSSSLLPDNDPTLLFTNAGMNQFKNVFLGHEKRPYNRAVTSQKCVRAGGKHNDLENVGHTARHHTFFEMLGNFSFGDYFKSEAIRLAWQLLTKDFGIPKEKLYVTVFQTDDEAADLWHKQEGVPKDRIFRFGEKDNFWRMGDTGPCGPCSEIFYDHGKENTGVDLPPLHENAGDRYVEIWNLVFMQFNEDGTGQKPLPKPSVDTGSGLERVSAALQGRVNNYETDLFLPLINKVSALSGKSYEMDRRIREKHPEIEAQCAAMRVLADHARACSFLIADGILPSNDGRGYVLRRILRRAVRYGRTLSDQQSIFPKLADVLVEQMGGFYPELKAKHSLIKATLEDEENRFLHTLDQGLHVLKHEMDKLGANKTLPGPVVFKLYDTFGFPADLTQLIAKESKVDVDLGGFEEEMTKSRAKAKASWKGQLNADHGHQIQLAQAAIQKTGATQFAGYEGLSCESEVTLLSNGSKEVKELSDGATGILITPKTPFYGEGGGQVGDTGTAKTHGGGVFEILNTLKVQDVHLHFGKVTAGQIKVGDKVTLQVENVERASTANNHSATHLLHAALRKVLGTHVGQAGSLVNAQRLRFDFTHNKPLTEREIFEIEKLVNEQISRSHNVAVANLPYKEALAKGAVAMFGEKYGDVVRVIQMGDFSTELCGGTHVSNTAQIRAFTILNESGVSAGVRRIEAITGGSAIQYLSRHAEENLMVRKALGLQDHFAEMMEDAQLEAHQDQSLASHSGVLAWIEKSKQEIKRLEKEIKSLQAQSIDLDEIWKKSARINLDGKNLTLITQSVELEDRQVLSSLVDQLKTRPEFGAAIFVGRSADGAGHPILVAVADSLSKAKPAGNILKEVTAITGGRGGGKPTFAQGAVEKLDKLPEAFQRAIQYLS